MAEATTFETLQKDIVHKLSECFEVSRSDLLKIEPTLLQWKIQLQQLEQYRDINQLDALLRERLGLVAEVEGVDQEALLQPLRNVFQEYLNHIPSEKIEKSIQILESIKQNPLNSYPATSEFIKLRSQLSQNLNDHSNEKFKRGLEQISGLLDSTKSKLAHFIEEQKALDSEIRDLAEGSTLYKKPVSLALDTEGVITQRYNIDLTQKDLINLKEHNKHLISHHLVDFFAMFLNERSSHDGVLFLDHNAFGLEAEEQENLGKQEQERIALLKRYFENKEVSFWNRYQRVVIPYRDEVGEWGLIIIENHGKTVLLVEFEKTVINKEKAGNIIHRVKQLISQSGQNQETQETSEEKLRKLVPKEQDSGKHSSGELLLWEMFQLAEKRGNLESEEYQVNQDVTSFLEKLLETLVSIGLNNDGFLKFDELL